MHAPQISTLLVSTALLASLASAQTGEVRTGAAAFDDWKVDAPGVRRLIRSADLPAPPKAVSDPEASIASNAKVIDPPQGALPKVPDGFVVQVFASGFRQPRTMRIAPATSSCRRAAADACCSSAPTARPARQQRPRSSPRTLTGPTA